MLKRSYDYGGDSGGRAALAALNVQQVHTGATRSNVLVMAIHVHAKRLPR
jgi:hypothetical protein